jgi:hypothetical protein
MTADSNGEITLSESSVVLNMPQIIWPEGQMMVKEDKILTDETPYDASGAQLLQTIDDINASRKCMINVGVADLWTVIIS